VSDLTAPDRDFQLRKALTSQGYRRRFDVLTFWWRGVENDGEGRARLPRECDGFLHGVDIKQSGSARDNNERCRLDSFDCARRAIRRGINEDPFYVAILRGLFDNMGDATFYDL